MDLFNQMAARQRVKDWRERTGEKMTFKLTPDHVDTWLKTRNGRKVKCVDRDDDTYLILDKKWDIYSVSDLGEYDCGSKLTRDIIGEWKEPEVYEGWIALFKTKEGRKYIGVDVFDRFTYCITKNCDNPDFIDAIYIKHAIGENDDK